MKLSRTEEQLMEYLWTRERAQLKELISDYPDPKPAKTTVATLLKRMMDKKYVDRETEGKTRLYFPLVAKEAYFANHINGLIKKFFNNSSAQFASFFTAETNLTETELKDLKQIVEKQIEKQKK